MTRRAAAALSLLLVGGCAAPLAIGPGAPLEVRAEPLPPYQVHETCAWLAPGDLLHYRFEATAPLAFGILYREGRVVVMPVTRERASEGEGTFAPLDAQRYCLAWEAGAQGATLDYTVRVAQERAR